MIIELVFILIRTIVGLVIQEEVMKVLNIKGVNGMTKNMSVLEWASSKGFSTSEARFVLGTVLVFLLNALSESAGQFHLDTNLTIDGVKAALGYAALRTALKMVAFLKITPGSIVDLISGFLGQQTQPSAQQQELSPATPPPPPVVTAGTTTPTDVPLQYQGTPPIPLFAPSDTAN